MNTRRPEPIRIDRYGTGLASVLIHVPHAATNIPAAVRRDIVLSDADLASELTAITDWHTDRIAGAAAQTLASGGHGVIVARNPYSRLVVDPERFPNNTEPMNQVGMGAVYQRTSRGQSLRTIDPDRDEQLLRTYFHPYADAVADLVDQALATTGRCLIIDLHSYPAEPLPYELDPSALRPGVDLGVDPDHTPTPLIRAAADAFARVEGGVEINTPFAGTYVPLRHYRQDLRVQSLMVEVRRDLYLTDTTTYDNAAGDRLGNWIAQLADRWVHHHSSSEGTGR